VNVYDVPLYVIFASTCAFATVFVFAFAISKILFCCGDCRRFDAFKLAGDSFFVKPFFYPLGYLSSDGPRIAQNESLFWTSAGQNESVKILA
jgi:hypothetical protein